MQVRNKLIGAYDENHEDASLTRKIMSFEF